MPEIYIGGRLGRKGLNCNQIWKMSSVDYVKALVKNLEEIFKKQGMKLPAKATTPMASDHRPELDATAKLDANNITMFQELIGELRWAIEIYRVDIQHDVLKLSARAITIMSSDYRPELDATAEIDANDINMFQGLIGELIWAT